MRAAFVTSSVSREAGGLFFAMTRLARSLSASGSEIVAHGVCDAHSAQDKSEWNPVPCHAHLRRGPGVLAWSPALGKALKDGGFELAHTHGLWQWPSVAVHAWHRRTGNPYLVSPHGMLDPWALALSQWKKRIASAWYESAHLGDAACIHALCQSEAAAISAYGLRNPIAVIPNGVDLPEETEDRFASRLKTKDRRKILLFLGRIHPKKGLVNALRAWHALRTTDNRQLTTDNWQFAIAGWDQGGHEAELKRLCDELGLKWTDAPAVEFVGGGEELSVVGCRLSEVLDVGAQHSSSSREMAGSGMEQSAATRTADNRQPTTDNNAPVAFLGPAFGKEKDLLLRSASAFILPSLSEGLPMAVLEAWSYGLPVLMTEHCNLPEGFAADAAIRIGTDSESIAEGMRVILQSTIHDLKSIGRNGRSLVERQFTWPQVAAQMKEVYEWVLGGGPRPDCVRD